MGGERAELSVSCRVVARCYGGGWWSCCMKWDICDEEISQSMQR